MASWCKEGEGKSGDDLYRVIEDTWGLKIIRVIRHKSTPPTYRLVIEGGQIVLGNSEAVWSQAHCRRAVLDATNRLVPAQKVRTWEAIVQAIGVGTLIKLAPHFEAILATVLQTQPSK